MPQDVAISLEARLNRAMASLDALTEALSRKQLDRSLAPIERKLQTKLDQLFRKQGNALLRDLGKLRSHFSESAESAFDKLFDAAIFDTSADMQDAIDNAVKAAVLLGGKHITRQFDASRVFSLTNARAVAYTKNYAADRISGIDQTTKDDIRRIVLVGIENGTSYAEVARQIKARYTQFAQGVPQHHIRSRAELIAVTEAGNAYQRGNLIAAQELRANGLTIEKSWSNVGDKRVSAGCLANTAAGWIDLDTDFPSGDATPLRFPGCRCAAQYRRKQ